MTAITTKTVGNVITRWTRRRFVKVVIDSALLIGFLAKFVTREGPDYTLHSWIGVLLVPAIALHLAGSIGWIRRVWAGKRHDRDFGLGVLNALLGFLAGTCILTGFPIWLEWSDAGAWSGVHTVTGFASILIMLVHLWKNRARITRLDRR